MTVGTTDREKKFHPFGLGITDHECDEDFEFVFNTVRATVLEVANFVYKPTTLIADNAHAITNGFASVFDKPIRVIYYIYY
jgi:hypothetical protein